MSRRLTQREQEILHLVAQGYTNRQIASHFDISPKTVDTHLQNIYKKLCVQNRTEAVHRYRRDERRWVSDN